MIVVKNLRKEYGERVAVADISFEVAEGKTLVLVGTSGCGKTTTLKMINRLIEPIKGNIKIAGKNVLDEKPEALRKNVGYVLQNTALFPHYTVAENIGVVPGLLGWDANKKRQRIDELLHKLKLPPAEHRNLMPAQLSGGQQQRVGLARALAASPPVMLMDEPFAALDTITRASIKNEFKNLDEFKNKTIILVTHDVEEAFELGDNICLLDQGKLIQYGTKEELLFKPKDTFVTHFLKEHQLILELKTVTVEMLWKHLQRKENTNSNMQVEGSINIWETMQLFDNAGNDLCAINKTGEQKVFDYALLMQAFSTFKNTMQ